MNWYSAACVWIYMVFRVFDMKRFGIWKAFQKLFTKNLIPFAHLVSLQNISFLDCQSDCVSVCYLCMLVCVRMCMHHIIFFLLIDSRICSNSNLLFSDFVFPIWSDLLTYYFSSQTTWIIIKSVRLYRLNA